MRLRVLGTLEIGTPTGGPGSPVAAVPLRAAKLRRLLAALVVRAGAVVSVDWLADVLWGAEQPADAEGALHNLVSRLRTALRANAGSSSSAEFAGDGAGPLLLTRAPGYLLEVRRDDVDALAFEDLVAAARRQLSTDPAGAAAILDEGLALWRGPAYAEFADEDWAGPEATRLEELRVTAREDRAEAALSLGLPEEAGVRLDALVSAHPLRERPHALLMLALYRAGRQADALGIYRRYRTRLDEELGLEPSAALQRLEAQILRQHPALDLTLPAAAVPEPRGRSGSAPGGAGPEPTAAEPGTGGSSIPAAARSAQSSPGAAENPGDASPPGNLPAALPELVGRAEALDRIDDDLRRIRTLTLTGPGGVGKTSLALHAAARAVQPTGDARDRFPDGAWRVELAAVARPEAVVDAVTTLLGVQQRQGLTPTERLVAYLRPKRLLLLLDNCDHVVDEVARLVDAVATGCPRVTVLATSREPLGVESEHLRPIAPLPVPVPGAVRVADVAAASAVRLFVERAQAAAPEFDLGEHNAAMVAEICRRLDGMPLALELAATRMRSMTPAEVVERLGTRFHFLRSTKRLTEERHRTLRAVVDWSYSLLDEQERRVFDRISVFAGDFPLAAAARVAGETGADVTDVLSGLVDKSMLHARTADGGSTRYALLDTLRAYGRERLAERGEPDVARRAHAQFYAEFAETAAAGLLGPDCRRWADRLDREFDEVRAAHGWAVDRDVDLAVRLVAALVTYAEIRMPAELFTWAERTLEVPAHRPVGEAAAQRLPTVCAVAASGARFRGDLPRAAVLAESGLTTPAGSPVPDGRPELRHPLYVLQEVALFEGRLEDSDRLGIEVQRLASTVGDALVETVARLNNALARAYSGRFDEAAEVAAAARRRAEEAGTPIGVAWACYAEGEVRLGSDPRRALVLLDEALARGRSLGDEYLVGVALVSAASLHGRVGDPARAAVLFRDVLEHWHRAGNWTHQWTAVRNVVELLARVGADEDAAVLHGAVTSRATAAPVWGADAAHLGAARDALLERLGRPHFAELAATGADLSDQDVVARACEALDRSAARGGAAARSST